MAGKKENVDYRFDAVHGFRLDVVPSINTAGSHQVDLESELEWKGFEGHWFGVPTEFSLRIWIHEEGVTATDYHTRETLHFSYLVEIEHLHHWWVVWIDDLFNLIELYRYLAPVIDIAHKTRDIEREVGRRRPKRRRPL